MTVRTWFGAFELDSDLRQVTCEGREIHLTPKAFDLLTLLVAEAGRVITKKELHERLWPESFVSDATLVGLVKMLRRTLGDRDARAPIIRTTHGIGYAFVAPIERRPSPAEDAPVVPAANRRIPLAFDEHRHRIGGTPASAVHLDGDDMSHRPRQFLVGERGAAAEDRADLHGARGNRAPVAEHAPLDDRADVHRGLIVTGSRTVAPSVAVLPFTDLSPHHDQAYLCEGLAEELIHALSAIDGLNVSARSSSFPCAGSGLTVRDMGARLGVDTILEGSVRMADDRLRVTARLIDVSSGFQRWSERYDRTLEDLFAVQDEMAHAIVAKLQVTLHTAPAPSSRSRHPDDLEAYSLYLQGRHYWSRRVKGSLQLATACFERAIARDPSYALAYAGLADVYTTLGLYGGLPARAASSKAKPAAQQALLLNDELSEAHYATACIDAFLEWDFVAAEREFRRAIALRPSAGLTHSSFAYLLTILGRFEEASVERARAQAAEPMSPLVRLHVATTLFLAWRFEEGFDECRRALEIDPSFALAHWAQSIVLTDLGRYDAALDILHQALTSSWDFFPVAAGWIYTAAGQYEKADHFLKPLRARSPIESRFSITFAWIALTRGEFDQAFAWLECAYEDRNPLLLQIGVARRYQPLRNDPRFAALLKKVGLDGVRPLHDEG